MTHVGALDIDIDAVRTKYTEAIDAYRDAAHELDAGRPAVAASSFGAGFAREGQRIVDALDALHSTSQRFLAARGENWGQVLSLSDATVAADQLSSEYLASIAGGVDNA
ncbi:hypothetical protein [Corynebacterium sp. ACRQP]|uniref:hypothetical protein n=1 Tax=Corynebacterium sp. ACRQP TaxID=2918195 RepID=UPI001EF4A3CE|nr:hypothetical protein [Corynebacterium sp. ACRQP]MCG7236447.1 hypothetical protein [Corynebacterium sp. ACRQP]